MELDCIKILKIHKNDNASAAPANIDGNNIIQYDILTICFPDVHVKKQPM